MKLEDIIKWGAKQNFNNEPIRLNVCSIIGDKTKFFNSHVLQLTNHKKNGGKTAIILPTYEMVLEFIKVIELEKQKKTA